MKLKQQFEDFIVKEISKPELCPKNKPGEYTYFLLTKTNWTTMRAIEIISKACHTSKKRFKFAGTKDRRAITTQLVSAWKIPSQTLNQLNIKDLKIEVIGTGNDPISLGTLEGNYFEVTVRDLSSELPTGFAKKISEQGFPNYFGKQRFGRGNTHLIGKSIIKGDLEKAAKIIITASGETELPETQKARDFALKNWKKWSEIIKNMPNSLSLEKAVLNYLIKNPTDYAGAIRKISKPIRRLYIHAYQSFLFNKALSNTLKTKTDTLKLDDLEFPTYKTSIKDLKQDLIIPGYGTKLKTSKYNTEIKSLLKSENIELEDFKVKRMPEIASKGALRTPLIKPKNLRIIKTEPDDLNKNKLKTKVLFDLPKGSYATILLRTLFQNE